MTTVTIIDGYTDEPAGLGVPPYIDVYPRYIAGAIWYAEKTAKIYYFTVDKYRINEEKISSLVAKSDILIIVGGIVVPGRYLVGKPITPEEILNIPRKYEHPLKILAGPIARFGTAIKGGKRAITPQLLEDAYDLVIRGDPALIIHDLMVEKSVEKVNRFKPSTDYSLIDKFAVIGAHIITQHPNYGFNLTVELETFRGCSRWLTGGCSFCIEPRLGRVYWREQEAVAREVKALYELGVRAFRIGRQSDLLVYKSKGLNEVEFPEPSPEELEKLFSLIRGAAPSVETLHIDNVNPMSIALHEEKAIKALKVIIKYHTPGDVAALGVESVDPQVARANNLGNTPEDVMKAIRIINMVGARRGWNGLPELLPGINFVLGLKGETAKTFMLNKEFLQEILQSNLLIRRVNIREVLPLPGTPMWEVGDKIARKHSKYITGFKKWVRENFDVKMMRRVFPPGTVVRRCYVESTAEGKYAARPTGSYPVTVFLNYGRIGSRVDCVIYGHKARSLLGVVFPLSQDNPEAFIKLFGSRAREYLEKIRENRFEELPPNVQYYIKRRFSLEAINYHRP